MLILCLLAVTVAGCEASDSNPEPVEIVTTFEGGTARIETATDTFVLQVQIAQTDEQRRVGLMRRETLAPDSGMIFIFPREQSPQDVFWMYQTLIPLSIAFLDADGRIGSIRDMEPCPSPYPQYCPYYEATVSFLSALEVNRGYFTERGITVGDRVVLERD
jgi:uncharacterized membrane protein (UPF0127 family)